MSASSPPHNDPAASRGGVVSEYYSRQLATGGSMGTVWGHRARDSSFDSLGSARCRSETSLPLLPPPTQQCQCDARDRWRDGTGQWGAGCEAAAGTIIKPTHQSGCDLTACLLSCVLRSFWVEPSALFVSEGDAKDALVLPAFTNIHPRPHDITHSIYMLLLYYCIFFACYVIFVYLLLL